MNIFKLLASVVPVVLFTLACSSGTSLIKLTEEKGSHGGVIQKNDQYQVELVVKDEHLKLYVSSLDGNKVASEKVMAKAMVAHTMGDFEVDFQDMNSNLLVAHGDFSDDSVKVVILDINVENNQSDTLIFNLEATAAGPQVDSWSDDDEGH